MKEIRLFASDTGVECQVTTDLVDGKHRINNPEQLKKYISSNSLSVEKLYASDIGVFNCGDCKLIIKDIKKVLLSNGFDYLSSKVLPELIAYKTESKSKLKLQRKKMLPRKFPKKAARACILATILVSSIVGVKAIDINNASPEGLGFVNGGFEHVNFEKSIVERTQEEISEKIEQLSAYKDEVVERVKEEMAFRAELPKFIEIYPNFTSAQLKEYCNDFDFEYSEALEHLKNNEARLVDKSQLTAEFSIKKELYNMPGRNEISRLGNYSKEEAELVTLNEFYKYGITDSDILGNSLATFRLETAHGTSDAFLNKNNWAGHGRELDGSFHAFSYRTPEMAAFRKVEAFVRIMEQSYANRRNEGLNPDEMELFYIMHPNYAPNDDNWIDNMKQMAPALVKSLEDGTYFKENKVINEMIIAELKNLDSNHSDLIKKIDSSLITAIYEQNFLNVKSSVASRGK